MSLKGKRQEGWEGGRKKREERGKAKKKEKRESRVAETNTIKGDVEERKETEQRKEGARWKDKRDGHRKEIEKV